MYFTSLQYNNNGQRITNFIIICCLKGIKTKMDSDDEVEEFQSWKGVPATIVLINAFNPCHTDSPSISHAATCRMMRQYLRQSSTQYLAVCLYGTDETNTESFGTQNIIELCKLNLPNLDDYKKLKCADISSFGQTKELKFSEALWHCSKIFNNCKKQLLSRTILILTRLDVPPIESDYQASYERVSDMVKSNIDIKILNVSQNEYKIHTFYENFIIDSNNTIPKPICDRKELEILMYQQSHRHLAIAQLSFEIGNGLDIGVGVYSLLKSGYQQKKVNLDRDTNAIVTTVNKTIKVSTEPADSNDTNGITMDVDDSEKEQRLPVLKSELLHCQQYGGELIEFNDKEKRMICNPFGTPMLKLLGFKPAVSMSKEKWFLQHGYFLFPNENLMEGSTTAFKALHQACLETKVVAVCVLCTRVNSRPHIVALSPCQHPFGLNAEIGFDVIIIPFMESVRQVPVIEDDEHMDILQGHKITMKDILQKLQFDYKPDMFENPKLQSQFRAIETIALADEEEEPFTDTTKPNPESFHDIQDDLFEEIFGPFGALSKRPTPKDTSTSSKRAKLDNEIDDHLLQDAIRNKKVDKFTVEQLKQIIRSRNISSPSGLTGKKKKELVEIVYDNCSS